MVDPRRHSLICDGLRLLLLCRGHSWTFLHAVVKEKDEGVDDRSSSRRAEAAERSLMPTDHNTRLTRMKWILLGVKGVFKGPHHTFILRANTEKIFIPYPKTSQNTILHTLFHTKFLGEIDAR